MPAPTPTVPAYWDTFSGLVPCQVLDMGAPADSMLTIRITADRGPYKRGEVLLQSARHIIPRAHFHRSRRGPFHFYTTPYRWLDLLTAA